MGSKLFKSNKFQLNYELTDTLHVFLTNKVKPKTSSMFTPHVYTSILCSEKPYWLTCLSEIFVYCQW